jgi:predicted transcriptional regulator
LEWRKKADPIFDILELLDDDKVKEWQVVYKDNLGTYNYEEEDDD